MKSPVERITEFAGSLRFPYMFLLTAVVFVVDLLIPDLVPFVDEILLGLATLLLARWRRNKAEVAEPEIER